MGSLYCLLSAAGFGVMAIFAKLSYGAGVSVGALLVVRFGLAALILLAVVALTGGLARLDRRTTLVGLAMGACGYAVQAGLYLAAVSRVDASQVALVFSVYPVLVMVAAVLTRREPASRRRSLALAVAIAGLVFVVNGATAGSFDLTGALLSFAAAVVYTAYILVGDRATAGTDPVPLTAMVCLGAFLSCLVGTSLLGGVDLGFGIEGWFWLVVLVGVSTVAAILLFFAGLARVGPTVTSLLSVTEPVVTVAVAALVFADALSTVQVLGGLLVLVAVVIVQWPTAARLPQIVEPDDRALVPTA
ncbi:DMT family transporter [Marmoricola sp. RAF53]|uniref:DMT family transporter n=1 Tax=Marmoricola sp. RAF53 TaxID=3233059 RepID=UPI003F9C82BD